MARPIKNSRDAICVICDKKFFYKNSSEASYKKKTCSRECTAKYYSAIKGGLEIHKCELCGKETKSKRWYIKKGKRFCGDECRLKWFSKLTPVGEDNLYWRGGKGKYYYGKNWTQVRREARERDNNTCQLCFKTKEELGYNLVVHHKTPFIYYGTERYLEANDLDNLISYCRSCHLKIEWAEQPKLRNPIPPI